MLGNLFGDTIKLDLNGREKTFKNVTFIQAGEGKIYFKLPDGYETSKSCDMIIEFIDDGGHPVEYDCNAELPKIEVVQSSKLDNPASSKLKNEIKPQRFYRAGGLFISLGSIILFTNLNAECDDCTTINDFEAFSNNINGQQKIGYLFIAIGGLIIAFAS